MRCAAAPWRASSRWPAPSCWARCSRSRGCGRRRSSSTWSSSATCSCYAARRAASGWPPVAWPVRPPARRCAPPRPGCPHRGWRTSSSARSPPTRWSPPSSRSSPPWPPSGCRTPACRWPPCTRCAPAGSSRPARRPRPAGRTVPSWAWTTTTSASPTSTSTSRAGSPPAEPGPCTGSRGRQVGCPTEGLWRSPVAHLVRIEGVRGSNPLSSTPSPHDGGRRDHWSRRPPSSYVTLRSGGEQRLRRPPQQVLGLAGRKWLGEVVALAQRAGQVVERLQLVGVLQALRNDLHAQGLAELDDGRGHRARLRAGRHAVDEGLVDLQRVDREPAQVGQRRVPRAEVVEGQADAELLDLLELVGGVRRVLHEQGLGDLQGEQ